MNKKVTVILIVNGTLAINRKNKLGELNIRVIKTIQTIANLKPVWIFKSVLES